jgi:hypothetical protein
MGGTRTLALGLTKMLEGLTMVGSAAAATTAALTSVRTCDEDTADGIPDTNHLVCD